MRTPAQRVGRGSLRRTIIWVSATVAAVAVIVSGALIVLTTLQHHVVTLIAAAVESVYLAQAARVDLLLHAREPATSSRREAVAEELRRKVHAAGAHATSTEEARVQAQAESATARYLANGAHEQPQGDVSSRWQKAWEALNELVRVNRGQSARARHDAQVLDSVGDVVGFVAAGLVLAMAAALVFRLRRSTFQPLLALASAMDRFAGGDWNARATESGPAELREMCARFNEMAEQLAAQRRAQIAFLGSVAHDLRNPLSALKLSVMLLAKKMKEPGLEPVRPVIERIDRQLARMERLLGDFLDRSQIEAGEVELRLDVHDLREIVREVVDLFAATSPEHDLVVDVPDAAVTMRCDHLRLEQVMTNLVSNAIKYSPQATSVAVSLRMPASGGEAVISVRDHGVGLTERDRQRVFEPFMRSKNPARAEVAGTGLGLFVVRRLVEAHGGRVEVESTPGEGSTFRVHLPLAARHNEPPTSNVDWQSLPAAERTGQL